MIIGSLWWDRMYVANVMGERGVEEGKRKVKREYMTQALACLSIRSAWLWHAPSGVTSKGGGREVSGR